MSHPSQSFKPILNTQQGLYADYLQKIRRQQQLLNLVKSVLPAELGSHTRYCVMNANKVVLYTESASWSSQLRFYQQTILQKLQEEGYRQASILQIKLMTEHTPKGSKLAIKIPNKESIDLLRQQCRQRPNDKLTKALSKLGETLDRLSSKRNDSSERKED